MKIVIFLAAVSAANVFVGVEGVDAVPTVVQSINEGDGFRVLSQVVGISAFEFHYTVHRTRRKANMSQPAVTYLLQASNGLWIATIPHADLLPGEIIQWRTKVKVNGTVREGSKHIFTVPTPPPTPPPAAGPAANVSVGVEGVDEIPTSVRWIKEDDAFRVISYGVGISAFEFHYTVNRTHRRAGMSQPAVTYLLEVGNHYWRATIPSIDLRGGDEVYWRTKVRVSGTVHEGSTHIFTAPRAKRKAAGPAAGHAAGHQRVPGDTMPPQEVK